MKAINLRVQEGQQMPNTRGMKKITSHIITKLLKISGKETILKPARAKKVHNLHKNKGRRVIDFSLGSIHGRRQSSNIFN